MAQPKAVAQPRRKTSLIGVVEDFLADSVARFPQLDSRLAVILLPKAEVFLPEELKRQKTLRTKLQRMARKAGDSGPAWAEHHPATNLHLIFVDAQALCASTRVPLNLKGREEALMLLDHELAHHCIRHANGQSLPERRLIEESISDAYALIRHYQRCGADSDFAHTITSPHARLTAFVYDGDKDHFSTPVLDEIIKRRHTVDFNSLDHAQTVELARRFALSYAMPYARMKDAYTAFAPVRQAFNKAAKKQGGSPQHAAARATAAIAFDKAQDPFTARAAAQLLRAYVDGVACHDGLPPVKLRGAQWDKVRRDLATREKELSRHNVLAGMPRKRR